MPAQNQPKLVVTTPCSRLEYLTEIHRSIFLGDGGRSFDITWCIVFDANALSRIPTTVLEAYSDDPRIELLFNRCGPEVSWRANAHLNRSLAQRRGQDFWHYVLDDDNLLHPALLGRLATEMHGSPDALGFIFSQHVGGRDFSGLETRVAKPENVTHSKIDQAQYLVHSSLLGDRAYDTERGGDGRFIAALYQKQAEAFVFVDETLCYYNQLRQTGPSAALPRILVVGRTDTDLRSKAHAKWENDRLTVECVRSDREIGDAIARFDPDAILTFDASPDRFPSLYDLPFDFRRRWIDVAADIDLGEAGERAYRCAITYTLNRNEDDGYRQPLVSILTPLCDTGEELRRTYRSVAAQTHTNWEWVLVEDSPHSGVTLAIAEEIARNDRRVAVYDIHPKSGGTVGEAKHRAAALAQGRYLLELDHDDELTPWAVELMVEAFEQYPQAGFAYSDCTVIDRQMRSITYPEGFAFGYGKYYQETYRGTSLQVVDQHAINPKTIRHIVGIPNHFRAWRRDVYHAIGGHNRRLSVADDYELVVRTFLETRMVHVPRLCYLQYLSRRGERGTTQSTALGDIQRRVRSIAWHYEDRIRERFAELGLRDWASEKCPDNPLAAQSLFGAEEQSASLRMELPERSTKPGSESVRQ